jgi:hypothetical protein
MTTHDQIAYLEGQVDALLKICFSLVNSHPNKAKFIEDMKEAQSLSSDSGFSASLGEPYINGHRKVVATLAGDVKTLESLG